MKVFCCVILGLLGIGVAVAKHQDGPVPWQAGDLIQSAELAREMAVRGDAQPVVFQVGFQVLYKAAHIPGAKYAGPCAEADGVDALKAAVKDVPADREVVLYCGCCPWTDCPNIRPAYTALKQAGVKHLRVLEIPTNFRTDWTAKGFPIEKSDAPAPSR